MANSSSTRTKLQSGPLSTTQNVLKACLPGCEVMERTSDNSFEASMSAKIGPVKAKFQSEMTLEDVQAPVSYVITGRAKAVLPVLPKDARVSFNRGV